MRVVSDTSPLCNLAIIDRLELLRRRYEIVFIPSAVADELSRWGHPSGTERLRNALIAQWLIVEHLKQPGPAQPPLMLDRGETEAILLAAELKAEVLLMDEKRGRAAARQRGLVVAGVLGELIHAKLAGWIPSVGVEVHRLRTDAGFFVDAGVERFILSQVGE